MSKKYIPKQFSPIIYPEWYELFRTLTDKQRTEILYGITLYPSYEPQDCPIWFFIESQLKNQYENFKVKCEKNKESIRSYWGNERSTNDNEGITKDNLLPKPVSIPESKPTSKTEEKETEMSESGQSEVSVMSDSGQSFISNKDISNKDSKDNQDSKKNSQQPKYMFEGSVIKLNYRDYYDWKVKYNMIPDFDTELKNIDDWFVRKIPDNPSYKVQWFFMTQNMLKKKQEKETTDYWSKM